MFKRTLLTLAIISSASLINAAPSDQAIVSEIFSGEPSSARTYDFISRLDANSEKPKPKRISIADLAAQTKAKTEANERAKQRRIEADVAARAKQLRIEADELAKKAREKAEAARLKAESAQSKSKAEAAKAKADAIKAKIESDKAAKAKADLYQSQAKARVEAAKTKAAASQAPVQTATKKVEAQTSSVLPSASDADLTAEKPQSVSWDIDTLNNAKWYEGLTKGQLPIYAKAQVLLDRMFASPGAIDGTSGKNTLKSISAFQTMNGIKPSGILDLETWMALNKDNSEPAFESYTITKDDVAGPFAKSIPTDYALKAKMKGLYYTSVQEMLSEKFHMDERFMKKLNPNANFNKVGETILVANVRQSLPEDVNLIIAHKSARQVYVFNHKNKMIAAFPATIGSTGTPSPKGTHTVTAAVKYPWYNYSPKNFVQGNNLKSLSVPPGPNGPVGNVWIALSKPSFGIHGTPNPSTISKTASHGCIRLTNWDATQLSDRVKKGIVVKFLE